MGAFDYDGFLVKMLVKAANMMIVSFFWLISHPVLTAIPATAALFNDFQSYPAERFGCHAQLFFRPARFARRDPFVFNMHHFWIAVHCSLAGRCGNWYLLTLYYAFGFSLPLF